MAKQIAIDFGTSNTYIYVKGKGIVLEEPSVVAMDINSNKILAVGNEAQQMIGKTPTNIKIIKPLKYGSVDKFDIAIKMLRKLIEKTSEGIRLTKVFSRAQVLVGVPSSITQVETRGIEEVIKEAGAKRVILIKDVVADAISTGASINEPKITFIVDIGGGTTDVAAIALGGILAEESIKIGGFDFDNDIIQYIKKKYNIEIGELSAEQLKMDIADAIIKKEKSREIIGQDLATGLPVTIAISNKEIYEGIRIGLSKIVITVKKVIENCPPESAADILNNGITMVGGGSQLNNLDILLHKELGIKTNKVEDPNYASIKGLGIMLDHLDLVNSMVLEYNPRDIHEKPNQPEITNHNE